LPLTIVDFTFYEAVPTVVVVFPSGQGCLADEPVDARNAGERVVDRRRQRAYRDFNDLRDTELAILGERAVTADVNSTINRGFKRAGVLRWDDCSRRLTAEHELRIINP